MDRVEVYIIEKDSGMNLYKYSLLGIEDHVKDELFSNFLTALNRVTKEVGIYDINLIRFGLGSEARFYSGSNIFTVFIIEFGYNIPLDGILIQQVLSGLAREITFAFEEEFSHILNNKTLMKIKNLSTFVQFRKRIDKIINRAGDEAFRLYQKSALMEGINLCATDYDFVQSLKNFNRGENVIDDFPDLIKNNPNFKRAIKKINQMYTAVWEIFAVPTYQFHD
jgi:hypothetical protein